MSAQVIELFPQPQPSSLGLSIPPGGTYEEIPKDSIGHVVDSLNVLVSRCPEALAETRAFVAELQRRYG